VNTEQCSWVRDDSNDGDIWYTLCDRAFVFNADGPFENSFKFCPYCGRELRIDRPKHEEEDT